MPILFTDDFNTGSVPNPTNWDYFALADFVLISGGIAIDTFALHGTWDELFNPVAAVNADADQLTCKTAVAPDQWAQVKYVGTGFDYAGDGRCSSDPPTQQYNYPYSDYAIGLLVRGDSANSKAQGYRLHYYPIDIECTFGASAGEWFLEALGPMGPLQLANGIAIGMVPGDFLYLEMVGERIRAFVNPTAPGTATPGGTLVVDLSDATWTSGYTGIWFEPQTTGIRTTDPSVVLDDFSMGNFDGEVGGGGLPIISTKKLQADWKPPLNLSVWRGSYDIQYRRDADPSYTTPTGSPIPGNAVRVRVLPTQAPDLYWLRIRTIDTDGTIGRWTELGPYEVGTTPDPGPVGGGNDVTLVGGELVVTLVETASSVGTSIAPAPLPGTLSALVSPNGSQYFDYTGHSTNLLVAHNFANRDDFADKSSNEQSSFVSRESIRNLLYSGASTATFAATLDWWTASGHDAGVSTGYVSNTVEQAAKQAAELKARGMDGSFPTWYGSGTTMDGHYHSGFDGINQAMLKNLKAFEQLGGLYMFMMMDHECFLPERGATDPTQQVLLYLDYANAYYFSSPAYFRYGGRPLFGFFGENLVTPSLNWSVINAHGASLSQGHPIWVIRNDQAWAKGLPDSDMATFGWPEAGEAVSTYLDRFYSHAASHPSTLCIGTAFKGFNDALADWGKGRIITQNNGQTWLDTFDKINATFSTSNQLHLLTADTWSDYEEGTEIETGIDSGLVMAPSLAGTTLSWTISAGNEACHVRYEIFASQDGNNVTDLGHVNVGSPRTFDLSVLPTGTWSVYVYAVGKCSIRNVMSDPVSITI